MSNPTTPFSWQMPTATDLVTDLPADFEVFGQAVATSMADLLGGTTGQILAKNTNADMDFVWTTAAPGDITAVTAGTGISGGGTSGDVTVTNSMATAIDAKGDLIVGTGADTFARLAVGATNGQVLTVDSAEATGLKYTTLATGTTFVGASCYTTAQITVPHDTDTAITFNSEFFDTDAFHSTSTNTARFTIPAGKSGKYLCAVSVQTSGSASEMGCFLKIRKNGSFVAWSKGHIRGGTEPMNADFSQVLDLAAADYIEFFVYQNSGASRYFFADDALAGAGYGQVSYLGA
jgi:hypothetical protein